MKKTNPGEALVKDLHDMQKKDTLDSFKNLPLVQMVKGLFTFTEGVALLVTSLYAIYQGHYADLPKWGAYALTVSGAFVLVPAAMILGKFFRKMGEQ